MENRIDATLSDANRDQILNLIQQINALLPFQIDLTPEERKSLVKMGDLGRPLVDQTLMLAEQDDSFLPRSFDVAEMRQDKELHENLSPIFIQLTRLYEAVQDTLMLAGSDLMMGALDIYRSAKDNGKGAHLDSLVPLVGRRFKRSSKKEEEENGDNKPPPDNPPV